ncbi:MAG: RNA polymerase sigma factor [Clostridium sp.]|nr:RNA polymerase sigma factor [Clostridium sp.]
MEKTLYLNNEIEELILNKKQKYFRVAYSIVLNKEDAEDALQEAYTSAIANISKLRNKEYFETWFYRILVNSCKKIIKKRNPFNVVHSEYFKTDNSDYVEDKIYLEELLKLLDVEHRQVVILKYVEQLSIKEISNKLDIPEGTVKSRLFYAIEKIRIQLKRKDEGL